MWNHRIRAARTVLACCILAISGLKAIAVIIAAVAHAHVCLVVKRFEPLRTSVLATAPAANSFFTASCRAIRILFAREALADDLICELPRLLVNTFVWAICVAAVLLVGSRALLRRVAARAKGTVCVALAPTAYTIVVIRHIKVLPVDNIAVFRSQKELLRPEPTCLASNLARAPHR